MPKNLTDFYCLVNISLYMSIMQASIIHNRNYSRWRHKGVAYELREGSYDTSNRTLASGMIFKHVCF